MTGPDPSAVPDDAPHEVTFRNAINGRWFTRRYSSRAEAEDAARTERPFNNTGTKIRPVPTSPDAEEAE
jgi:hypothetical protein